MRPKKTIASNACPSQFPNIALRNAGILSFAMHCKTGAGRRAAIGIYGIWLGSLRRINDWPQIGQAIVLRRNRDLRLS
jgi:hypothetical protein